MTTREFLNNVINGTMNEEMQETAKVYLANLDAKNEKRKTSPSNLQKKNESASRALKVITYLKDNAGTAFNRDEVALAVLGVGVACGEIDLPGIGDVKKGCISSVFAAGFGLDAYQHV